ncbi:MAG TPA: hypothetical protein VIG69_09195 [Candidatus Methylomirabilis sp.]|jgi:hypothetical protein
MADLDRMLVLLRQCREAIQWLRDARRETVTSLWFFRDRFSDPQEATREWKLVLDLMDNTFSVLLRGNQLTTDILRSLAEAEGDNPAFRNILTEKVERLEATGNRAVRGVRKFAEALDPNFFNTNARRARPPAFLTDGSDPKGLPKVLGHLQDLEALIVEEERQLVDLEGFLSLRARDLELGLQW